MDQLTELGLPEEQASAIRRLVSRYNQRVDACSILVGCFGLPDDWVSVAIPVGRPGMVQRTLAMGVSPEGAVHS